MTIIDFLNKLNEKEFKNEAISAVFHALVYDLNNETLNYNETEVKQEFMKLYPNELSAFGAKLGRCLAICNEELENLSSVANTTYAQNLRKIEPHIKQITAIYSDVLSNASNKKDSEETAIAQHDKSLKEIKVRIKSLNDDIVNANKLIDDKIFTLLINTVSILGIFVAIAFAGFGTMSIISGLDLKIMTESTGGFIKGIFFMLLIALLSYNLLLLLIYFIFKLSRPIMKDSRLDIDSNMKNKQQVQFDEEVEVKTNDFRFLYTVKLTPFFVIDGILFILTVSLFIACFIVK